MRASVRRFHQYLFKKVSGQSLAAFRIGFGVVLAWQALKVVTAGASDSWLMRNISGEAVDWRIPFSGFEWVAPWPEPWMSAAVWGMALAGVFITLGLGSRPAALFAGLTWTQVWLSDATRFNNHYYLISLLCLLTVFMPVDRSLSVRRLLRRRRGIEEDPALIPRWPLFLLRAQALIVYFFGALTKLTGDYLQDGEPMRTFLGGSRILADPPGWLGPEGLESLRAFLVSEGVVRFASWGGLLFDLLIGLLLILRRTRFFGVGLAIAFHFVNHFVLFDDIGVFPLLGIVLTLVFLDADWPGRVARWCAAPRFRAPDWRWALPGFLLFPPLGLLLGWRPEPTQPKAVSEEPDREGAGSRLVTALVLGWLAFQVLVPLRPWLIPGEANWTLEGNLFSWRMKNSVRSKDLHSLILRDEKLVSLNERFEPVLDWEAWRTTPVIFRHVPAEAVPWHDLPAVVLLLEPIIGERLIFNSKAQRFRMSKSSAQQYLPMMWMQSFGRRPETTNCLPLVSGFATLLHVSSGWDGAEEDRRALARVQAQLERLGGSGLSEHERLVRVNRVQEDVLTLLESPYFGEAVERLVRTSGPLELAGAPHEPDFMVLEDEFLFGRSGVVRSLRGEAIARAFWQQPRMMFTDFRRLRTDDWRRLPRALPLLRADGELVFWWNMEADLRDVGRRDWVTVDPKALRHYARRVARLWEEEHGNRPSVHGRFYVSVNLAEPRLLTDPARDLASEPARPWSHAPWILPPNDYPPPGEEPLAY